MNGLFLKIVNMSISASWLIVAVMIIRIILKKAPKWIHVLFWGIVGVRLLCPLSIESSFSLIPSAETIPDKVLSGPGFHIHTGIVPMDNRVNEYLGDRYFEGAAVSADYGTNVMTILAFIWVVGVIILLSCTIISCMRLSRRIDTAVLLRENIFQSENISSPFVFGILKPRIYLPYKLEGAKLEHVAAHEQAHIQRRDYWWKPLGFLILIIYWFNPLIWLAYVFLCRDIELACDEKVIKKLGIEQRADYSQALLDCSVNRRMITACPLAFGEAGVKERVKNILNYKKPAYWIVAVAVIICIVMAVCFLTNPASQNSADAGGKMVVMTPTDADIRGVFDSYLYVELDGKNYRYEQATTDTENVTADELLDRFTESADPENIDWKIYSVKEYPDYSAVLAVAGEEFECLYQYSPSRQSDPGALQLAKDAGCVTMEDWDVTAGQQIWKDFVKAAEEGRSASVRVACYYTLDPENCSEQYYEVYKEDYPVLYILNLAYDGSRYILRWNEDDKEYVKNYCYLMHYTGEVSVPDAAYDSWTRYVLTNDNTVTWEKLEQGMFSSQLGDYIDHYIIYTDLE